MQSLEDVAIGEATRILGVKRLTVKEAAATAARRAPGLVVAARALRRLLLTEDAAVAKAIPASIREQVMTVEPLALDDPAVHRVRKWLIAAPYEMTRCRTPGAAMAAAAPVAMLSCQLPDTPRDHALEERVVRAMQQQAVRKKDRGARRLGSERAEAEAPPHTIATAAAHRKRARSAVTHRLRRH